MCQSDLAIMIIDFYLNLYNLFWLILAQINDGVLYLLLGRLEYLFPSTPRNMLVMK